MSGLLQDEAEGYECQRLSKWFAGRIDARVVVRKYHTRNHMKPIVPYWRTPTSKPEIHMSWDADDNVFWYAKLDVTDHPVLGDAVVKTSPIVAFNLASGTIETKNTIYVPIP